MTPEGKVYTLARCLEGTAVLAELAFHDDPALLLIAAQRS